MYADFTRWSIPTVIIDSSLSYNIQVSREIQYLMRNNLLSNSREPALSWCCRALYSSKTCYIEINYSVVPAETLLWSVNESACIRTISGHISLYVFYGEIVEMHAG
jgi:hypothetical protein